MKERILASESFSAGGKHYFLDFKVARNNSNYISITRSDLLPDGKYNRQSVVVWEEDFHILIGCFSSLFTSVAYKTEPYETIYDIRHINQERKAKGIKSWEPQLRPREKMLEHGTREMSDAELLAMLIGSGTPNETAVELAQRILDSVSGNLLALSGLGLKELSVFDGMGVAKSCSIMATMELAKRMYPMLNVTPVKKIRVASGAAIRSSEHLIKQNG